MKLYCDPVSTTSRPVMLFAAEHDIAYERMHVDVLSHENREPPYLAINPNAIVPFLDDDGFTLGESSAILKYLAVKVGSPAYPADLKAQAKVDEAVSWFSTNLHEYFCIFTIYPNFGVPQGIDPVLGQAMMAFGAENCPRWLKVLDQHMIGDNPYVCGDKITIADYLGVAFITLGEVAAYDFGPYPNIRRWIANMRRLSSWDATYAGFNGFVSALRSQAEAAA